MPADARLLQDSTSGMQPGTHGILAPRWARHGRKVILEIGLTLEVLENHGVPMEG